MANPAGKGPSTAAKRPNDARKLVPESEPCGNADPERAAKRVPSLAYRQSRRQAHRRLAYVLVRIIVGPLISLESAILELMTGRPPNRSWARLSPGPAFVEKLRILIEDLTTPTDGRVPPFLRIFDADPQWRRYLFGRQLPETRVETMFLVLPFSAADDPCAPAELTCKCKESGLSTI